VDYFTSFLAGINIFSSLLAMEKKFLTFLSINFFCLVYDQSLGAHNEAKAFFKGRFYFSMGRKMAK